MMGQVAFTERSSFSDIDVIENLSSLIGKSEFIAADGDVYFAEEIDVNEDQNIIQVKFSNGTRVDIKVKPK